MQQQLTRGGLDAFGRLVDAMADLATALREELPAAESGGAIAPPLGESDRGQGRVAEGAITPAPSERGKPEGSGRAKSPNAVGSRDREAYGGKSPAATVIASMGSTEI